MAKFAKTCVLVQTINREKLSVNKKYQDNLDAEIAIMKRMAHKNIVRLLDTQLTSRHIYMVLEHCAGGDLSSYIKRHGPLPEAGAQHFFHQLVAAVKFLYSANLIHRDLKPQNLLLDRDAPDAVLKVADFGFARFLVSQTMAATLCGSPLYMAPEILRYHKYGPEADLWSVGTILFEMLSGKPPFTGQNPMQLLQNIELCEVLRFPAERRITHDCHNMLSSLLRRRPLQRIGFQDFFRHSFSQPGWVPDMSDSVSLSPHNGIPMGSLTLPKTMPTAAELSRSFVQCDDDDDAAADPSQYERVRTGSENESEPPSAAADIAACETPPLTFADPSSTLPAAMTLTMPAADVLSETVSQQSHDDTTSLDNNTTNSPRNSAPQSGPELQRASSSSSSQPSTEPATATNSLAVTVSDLAAQPTLTLPVASLPPANGAVASGSLLTTPEASAVRTAVSSPVKAAASTPTASSPSGLRITAPSDGAPVPPGSAVKFTIDEPNHSASSAASSSATTTVASPDMPSGETEKVTTAPSAVGSPADAPSTKDDTAAATDGDDLNDLANARSPETPQDLASPPPDADQMSTASTSPDQPASDTTAPSRLKELPAEIDTVKYASLASLIGVTSFDVRQFGSAADCLSALQGLIKRAELVAMCGDRQATEAKKIVRPVARPRSYSSSGMSRRNSSIGPAGPSRKNSITESSTSTQSNTPSSLQSSHPSSPAAQALGVSQGDLLSPTARAQRYSSLVTSALALYCKALEMFTQALSAAGSFLTLDRHAANSTAASVSSLPASAAPQLSPKEKVAIDGIYELLRWTSDAYRVYFGKSQSLQARERADIVHILSQVSSAETTTPQDKENPSAFQSLDGEPPEKLLFQWALRLAGDAGIDEMRDEVAGAVRKYKNSYRLLEQLSLEATTHHDWTLLMNLRKAIFSRLGPLMSLTSVNMG